MQDDRQSQVQSGIVEITGEVSNVVLFLHVVKIIAKNNHKNIRANNIYTLIQHQNHIDSLETRSNNVLVSFWRSKCSTMNVQSRF